MEFGVRVRSRAEAEVEVGVEVEVEVRIEQLDAQASPGCRALLGPHLFCGPTLTLSLVAYCSDPNPVVYCSDPNPTCEKCSGPMPTEFAPGRRFVTVELESSP